MNGKLRLLKTNKLQARVMLYELEHSALIRELRTTKTSNQRRAEIYVRLPQLKFERSLAITLLRLPAVLIADYKSNCGQRQKQMMTENEKFFPPIRQWR